MWQCRPCGGPCGGPSSSLGSCRTLAARPSRCAKKKTVALILSVTRNLKISAWKCFILLTWRKSRVHQSIDDACSRVSLGKPATRERVGQDRRYATSSPCTREPGKGSTGTGVGGPPENTRAGGRVATELALGDSGEEILECTKVHGARCLDLCWLRREQRFVF